MAQIETDENGHGIVVMSEYGGLGTYEITDMPFGTYRIYEERAPYNYERNSAVAQLVINEKENSCPWMARRSVHPRSLK